MSTNERIPLVNVDDLPLNQQLRMKRIYDGFTQRQLVRLLELPSAPFLCRMETGQKPIPKRLVERIEAYVFEDELINGVEVL